MSKTAGLMAGRRGLIMGVANERSIAWGIARAISAAGAEIGFTYQGDALGRRVQPLAESLGAAFVVPCDVEDEASMAAVFETAEQRWGGLDFVLHSIAYSDRSELKGRYADTSRENFRRTMLISCYSFTEVARRAAPLMTNGGSLLTLSFSGAERVVPNYNVMGVAKAALEASTRYMAADLGPAGIRVNALSAGPMRTVSGAAISSARNIFNWHRAAAPLKRSLTLEEVGNAGLYLLSDLSAGVTGETHHVDCGTHAVAMAPAEAVAVEEDGAA
ncbi:MAG: SDR family oxidoreductase [Proteobacteria bacterium]|nr:SDR family oxidoreductase [Pseudomonadota bacterium]